MRQPDISILMPVYNNAHYLRQTLDSICAQTMENYELIIIDDASTDGSDKIIQEYASRDSRIRIITNQVNLRVAGALNRGLSQCRSDLIARADGDDLYFPRRLELQKEYMDLHPHVGVAGSSFQEIDSDGKIKKTVYVPTLDCDLRFLLNFGCIYIHPSVIIRRRLLLDVNGYDEHTFRHACQDFDLWARVSSKTNFGNHPDVLMQYRIHPTSICKTRGIEGMTLYCSVVQRLLDQYLNRAIPLDKIIDLIGFSAYGKCVTREQMHQIQQLLREIAAVSRPKEQDSSLRLWHKRLGTRFLKQSHMHVWSDRAFGFQLFFSALRYDPSLAFHAPAWSQAVRILTPHFLQPHSAGASSKSI